MYFVRHGDRKGVRSDLMDEQELHCKEAKQANKWSIKSANPDTMYAFKDTKADSDRKPSINSANQNKSNGLAALTAQ